MDKVLSATEVRSNWSEVIDTVVRKRPIVMQRRRDQLTLLSVEQLDFVLEVYKLDLNIIKEDDNTFTGYFEQIDILGNAADKQSLIEVMIKNAVEYSNDYIDNFDLYYHSPNRKSHFPYVYKLFVHQNEMETIQSFINR